MDWTARIPIAFAQPPSISDRLWAFVGHWDLRYYVTAEAYMDLGAGSLGCAANVKMAPPWTKGTMGTIGRYCEIHPSVEIMAGGEHLNDLPVNVTFANLPLFKLVGDEAPIEPCRPVSVGHNVVISSGAQILSGVAVGDGAVIGAGAVVTKDVEPYSIVAGNPARELKRRDAAQPWWNFDPAYYRANKANIQEVAASPGPHQWRVDRPRLALKPTAADCEILGFVYGDEVRPWTEAPAPVREYLTQAFRDTPGVQPYWMADPWPD